METKKKSKKISIIKIKASNKIEKYTKEIPKIFIIFLLLIYVFFYYNNYIDNKFNDILPKLSLSSSHISSLDQIFNSRILYIPYANLTKEYIRYIRPIKDKEEEKNYSQNEVIIPHSFYRKRSDQLHFLRFIQLCLEEKLIDSQIIANNNTPVISVILPHYNRQKMLLKSIRSIQNQSLKNIEIIIVNDCSTDNSSKIFEYLLKTDPRIRIFHHVKNMGLFRTRVDGFLYSRGKYLISLEPDDLYNDNYVLEDAYNTLEIYKADSVKFLLRTINNYDYIRRFRLWYRVPKSQIVYGNSNIQPFHNKIFGSFLTIWNRLVKADIYIKGLYLLENYVLNFYKNVWDDVWQNTIINKVSNSFAIIRRVGYIYYVDGKGEGTIKTNTDEQKDKIIKEFLGFLYFDYNMLPKSDNKSAIINQIKIYYEEKDNIKLSFLKTKFFILYNLINMLISDPYVSGNDKNDLKKILKAVKEREKLINNKNNKS